MNSKTNTINSCLKCSRSILAMTLMLLLIVTELPITTSLPFIRAPSCGSKMRFAQYILGGAPSKDNAWPWLASVQFYSEYTGFHDHVCGATLIGPHWAVTAAHCVDPRVAGERRDDPAFYKIVFGANNLMEPSSKEQIIDVTHFVVHPDWMPDRRAGFPNDIALIHLAEPVDTLATGVGVACLPDHDLDVQAMDECWMAGWGSTDASSYILAEVLREAKTEVKTADECRNDIGNDVELLYTHICAGDPFNVNGPNACKGDSGGPLSCRRGSRWFAVGISSWSYHADCRPSIFTSLGAYRGWIKESTGL